MTKLRRDREEIVRKANELAAEYIERYAGCGQCVFLAVLDALRWGGLEIIPEDMEGRFFSGVCVTTAGIAESGEGTCGAINSGVLIMGLALGPSKEFPDIVALREACATIRDTLLRRCLQEYGSVLCKDVQRRFFGKAWDLTRDDMFEEFRSLTEGCIIRQAAQWTVESMLDEFEKGNLKLPN